jgi:hypothetical protein
VPRKKTEEEVSEEEARVTPMGIFHYALSYRKAAATLKDVLLKTPHNDSPVRFLYYHAIELYLKALLRMHGHTVRDLSQNFGHRTAKLIRRAVELGLVLTEQDKVLLDWIGKTDEVIRSRYFKQGFRRLPEREELERLCANLHSNVGEALRKGGVPVRI